ncbi:MULTISPECIES: TRAFAC clade GTPase domain-containing protein [Nocardiopsidaceae]|uniref:Double-GTPase 2 domain-containing protein n=2 Tax=Nocardiopsidaceae TaxID=83676 RepID=A0ABY6YT42_9ACTN|nr:hypothetical protein [Streptomonospora nanhaiensis]WAE75552.1 hypothetical protein OUQ99_10915 [Streptomonospora nanhaiensis]
MTDDSADAPRVLCPVCLSRVGPDSGELREWRDGEYRPLYVPDGATEHMRLRIMRTRAQVLCPNRGNEYPEHHLPYQYVNQRRDPVVVALVGAPRSGKTHLLASMVGAIQEQGLNRFGLSASPLDVNAYERFTNTRVRPLLGQGRVLARTNDDVWEFEVGLMVSDGSDQRAVAFFDVAGEVMDTVGKVSRQAFFDKVDGFVFVVSPDDLEDDRADTTFSAVLDVVEDKQDKAAVVVVGKADVYRYEHPVDRWLRDGVCLDDASRIAAETEDLYAFIDRYDKGGSYLRPWTEFGRSAIHAVSATGGARLPDSPSYSRPVRPQRTLQPFLTLMAMTGVATAPGARGVGL